VITCDYIPVPEDAVDEMLNLARLREGELIYDLGCGTGELLLKAAAREARGVGIEVSRRLVDWGREKIRVGGFKGRIEILRDNFFSPRFWAHLGEPEKKPYAIKKADVVYIYLTLQVHAALKPYLEKELREGARVVSYAFRLNQWKPVKEIIIGETPAYLFIKGKSF
jgi:SAM-dependent methyltransferase